jgi:acyl transferase domain-containing protein/NAD(P)-dependent dehydrogenase (short-subunit alcohol dehydrogenase family)/acyl carrier protein
MADHLSPEKQTLMALRALRQRVEELEGRGREPIAIVGMACRFPGGADSPEDYWDLLLQGRDAVSEIPRERMDLDPVFDARPQIPGKTYSRWAGMLDKPGDFDAEFFGISPREAVSMDPQQRLLLEVSWEALENAGVNPKSLAGHQAGVFVGITTSEYAQLQQKNIPRQQLTAYVLQGSALNATAGRLSYFFGLNGPSIAIDTACSSSLVAIDRACRSLREGESQFAIAAGVNVLATPESLIIASQWGMLSASGTIRAFSSGADGFVRGEGCGVLVLKRLSEAERSGDRILGVILGSSVNQDGASSGLTVPNGLAQQALLREAHRRAGIEAWQVGYVEAHGTGTELGDPIEAEALGAVFGAEPRGKKLLIGSVKTNVGHLESAAGVAGLIKVVLGLGHGVVPAQLHWERPSGHVRWSELPLEVVTEPREWPPIAGRRIAGVSSFGFSGTNAHVVVESWEQAAQITDAAPREEVLVVTARTEAALRALVERYAEFLSQSESGSESDWSEICYTAAVGRAVFGDRLAVVANTKPAAEEKLRHWLRGVSAEGVYAGQVKAGERTRNTVSGTASEVAVEFVSGATVDWAGYWSGRKLRRVALPTYAFQRERYWIEASAAQEAESGEATGRSFLGRRLRTAGVRGQYETKLTAASWIGEHVVEGRAVLPATGHLELMLEAGAEISGAGCVLEDVVLESRLEIAGERRVQTAVEEESEGRSRVRVYAEQADAKWERVSEGWLVGTEAAAQQPEKLNLEGLRERLEPRGAGQEFYAQLASRGLEFGERFRGVEQVWVGEGEALGEIVSRREEDESGWELRPWWLDACLQVAGLAAGRDDDGALYLPLSLERLEIYRHPGAHSMQHTWSHVTIRRLHADTLAAEVTVTTPEGSPLVRINNLRFRKFKKKTADSASWLYRLKWRAEELPSKLGELNRILVVGDGELAAKITLRLQEQGTVADSANARNLTQKLAAEFDAVLWVEDQPEPIERSSPGTASSATESSVRSLLTTVQQLLRIQTQARPRLYVVTTMAHATGSADRAIQLAGALLAGLATGVATEAPELRCTRLDCAIEDHDFSATRIVAEVQSNADSQWVAWRSGNRYIANLERLQAPRVEQMPARVQLQTGAGIEALKWAPDSQRELQPGEVEICVEATSLNFRDVMLALGAIDSDIPIGTDCAGTVLRVGEAVTDLALGDAVVAIAPGTFASHVVASRELVVRKPETLSFAEAAAQSIAYLTADYCLNTVARVRQGERVLIHAGAGGVGLAATHLCRKVGAEPIATAGSEEKRAFLREMGVARVYDSRSLAFGTEISGGVDIVLNSLAGEAIDAGLQLLNPGGRFIELGKTDLRAPEFVERKWPGVRYLPVDLTPRFAVGSSWISQRLAELFKEIGEGSLPVLPVTAFDSSRVKEAFRFMARAEHKGRVVVARKSSGRFAGTHLITGGMRGIGLKLAEWLAANGARGLVLVGRRAPDEAAYSVIERLRANGVAVRTVQGDIADPENARKAIEISPPDLRGVWHCAGLLDNASLEDQSWDRMQRVFRPKIDGAWNLHVLTRKLPIECFVLFSSWASIGGSYGQINHCAAASFLDGLAHFRRANGLPALTVDWGAWGETGAAADDEVRRNLERSGMEAMPPEGALEALRLALRSGETQVAIASIHWARYLAQRRNEADRSFYTELLSESDVHATRRSPQPAAKVQIKSGFAPAVPALETIDSLPAAMREAALLRTIAEIVRRTLDLHSGEEIDPDVPLGDLGMDSLLAIELRNGLSRVFHQQFQSTILFDYPTLRTLARYLDKEVLPAHDETPAAVPVASIAIASSANENSLDILETIEQMSDEEVESWFK